MAVTTTDQTSSPDAPSVGQDQTAAIVETPEAAASAEAAAPLDEAASSLSPDAILDAVPDATLHETAAAPNVHSAIADEILASEAQAAIKRRQMEARASHVNAQDGFSLRTRPPRVITPP